MPAQNSPFEYDAFITYRRKDGSVYAERLRHRLVDYVMPKGFPRRRLRIFLDRVYEQASEDFFVHTIEPALKASKWLIVVQTPEAVAPTETGAENWVAREVRYFRGLPQRNNVGVALAIGDFNDPLPAELAQELPRIDRVDIRTLGGDKPKLSEHELLTFIGPLHDVPRAKMPDLRRDVELRARRRRMTLATIATVVIVLLAILASVAFYQRDRAEIELARQASLRLAAEASRVPAGEIDLAYLLAVRAYEVAPTYEAARALMEVASREPRLVRYVHCPSGQMAYAVRFMVASRAVALACTGVLVVSSLDDGRELHREMLMEDSRLLEVVRLPGREWLVVGGGQRLRAVVPGQPSIAISRLESRISAMRASPNGTSLLTGDLAGNVRLWKIDGFAPQAWPSTTIGRIGSEVVALKFDHDGVAAKARLGSTWMMNSAAGALEDRGTIAVLPDAVPMCEQQPVFRYAAPFVVDETENLQAFANESNDVVVSRGNDCVLLRGNAHNLAALTAARLGERLLLASAGQIGRRRFGAIVWDMDQLHPFATRLLPPPSLMYGRAVVASIGSRAAVAREGEPLRVWHTSNWSALGGPPLKATAIALSHDASEIALVTDGFLRRFRIEEQRLREIGTTITGLVGLAYGRDGLLVALGEDALWRIGGSGMQRVAVPSVGKDAVSVCSRLTTDAALLLVVNQEEKLLVHDTSTGRVTTQIAMPRNMIGAGCSGLDAVNGKMAVRTINTYDLDPVQIFDFQSKKLKQTFQSPFAMSSGLPATLQEPVLSADGRLAVLSRGDEQSIIVWDVDSASMIGALHLPSTVHGWTMNDTGQHVLAATSQGVFLWLLAPAKWVEQARRNANRSLTADEARTYGISITREGG